MAKKLLPDALPSAPPLPALRSPPPVVVAHAPPPALVPSDAAHWVWSVVAGDILAVALAWLLLGLLAWLFGLLLGKGWRIGFCALCGVACAAAQVLLSLSLPQIETIARAALRQGGGLDIPSWNGPAFLDGLLTADRVAIYGLVLLVGALSALTRLFRKPKSSADDDEVVTGILLD